jgi:hypothetical protein
LPGIFEVPLVGSGCGGWRRDGGADIFPESDLWVVVRGVGGAVGELPVCGDEFFGAFDGEQGFCEDDAWGDADEVEGAEGGDGVRVIEDKESFGVAGADA